MLYRLIPKSTHPPPPTHLHDWRKMEESLINSKKDEEDELD
jgi:hypothetical protein